MKHGFVIHRQHQVIFVYLACINVIIKSNKQFHRILKILQIVFWKSRPHNWHKKISNVTSTSDRIQTLFNPFQSRKKCAAHTAWYSREDESLLKLATRLTFESSRLAFFIKKSTAIPRSTLQFLSTSILVTISKKSTAIPRSLSLVSIYFILVTISKKSVYYITIFQK